MLKSFFPFCLYLVYDSPFVSVAEVQKSAKPGDLIEFDRGHYKHWAMYYGTDKGSNIAYVINVPAESKDAKEVTITKEKLKDVAGASKVRVNNQKKVADKLGYKARSGKDALAAAVACVGTKYPYNLTGTNCEYYFTRWLYSGNGFSVQVNLHCQNPAC